MDEHEWIDKLRKEKVGEFSLYPNKMTAMEKEFELELPDIDIDEGDEDKKDSQTPSQGGTVKTITFTIGGLAIGVAVGAAAVTMTQTPPQCPATTAAPTQTQTTSQTPSQPRSTSTSLPATTVPGSAALPGSRP